MCATCKHIENTHFHTHTQIPQIWSVHTNMLTAFKLFLHSYSLDIVVLFQSFGLCVYGVFNLRILMVERCSFELSYQVKECMKKPIQRRFGMRYNAFRFINHWMSHVNCWDDQKVEGKKLKYVIVLKLFFFVIIKELFLYKKNLRFVCLWVKWVLCNPFVFFCAIETHLWILLIVQWFANK